VVMLVCPHEMLQNRSLQNEGTNMQDNSEAADWGLLRVAASFNSALKRDAAKARRPLALR
ncbi:MAG: hypothetical protein WBB96_15665, partial [Candidatus Dechloromonas phosphoritropha]